MDSSTISEAFASTARRHADRTVYRYFEGSWKGLSYAGLASLVGHINGLLASVAVRKGDRVALVSENRPEWCAAYLAIVLRGGIAVPLDIQLGPGEIANLLADAEPVAVVCSTKTRQIVTPPGETTAQPLLIDLDDLSPDDPTPPPNGEATAEIYPDDTASLIYTSGTTGNPKGVLLTHRNLCSDAFALIDSGLVTHNDNVLAVLPLHHTYPFMCTFLVPLFLGAATTFGPGLKAVELISAIGDNGVSVVVGVPKLFEMMRNGLMSKLEEKSSLLPLLAGLCGSLRRITGLNAGRILFRAVHEKFPAVKFFASGGARLDPSLMKDMEALGFTMMEGYGLTETSPVITFNPFLKRKPGSVGKPLPGVDIRLENDGEIVVKGPMVMKGYYRNPAVTAEVLGDGWFLTGDVGYRDEEGYLFITGRKKEVIVLSSGKNIYPEEVEKAYLAISLIKEICVTANVKNGNTDSVTAVIVPDMDYARKAGLGAIREALDEKLTVVSMKLPGYMRIKGYSLHPGPLPRTPLGKLRRFMVTDMVNDVERPAARRIGEDGILTRDETGRKVAESVRKVLGEKIPLSASDNLELDLGFDSLRKIALVSSLEESFSVRFPETFISGIQTVGDVADQVRRQTAERGSAKTAPSALSWKEILDKDEESAIRGRGRFSSNGMERILVYALFHLLKAALRIAFRLRVEGGENLPAKGPYVIAPNHVSYLDGFIIGLSLPFAIFNEIYFLGLRTFFAGPARSWLARLSHVIPIDSEAYLGTALKVAAGVVKDGGSLCIFPEGGRSYDGTPQPFKKGIGILALELGLPVVPASIKGSYEALPRGSFFPKPARIVVSFGPPLLPGDVEEKAASGRENDRYQRFADELRGRVIRLSEE